MPELKCNVVRYISDEPQPGVVEVFFHDVGKKGWRFVDKWPIFLSEFDPYRSFLPCEGFIRYTIIHESNSTYTIDTSRPDFVESDNGNSIFVVKKSQVTNI